MAYHIDTGLIKDKFKVDCECPLCEIEKIVQNQFIHEFLNDAVMVDEWRAIVNELGFCQKHFDLMFNRPNKLSLALQVYTRNKALESLLQTPKSPKSAKKLGETIEGSTSTCVICNLMEESMQKYYKTIAQLFGDDSEFQADLVNSKGFCFHHYAELLKYSSFAGLKSKKYLTAISEVMQKNFARMQAELKWFCDKHDYRNHDKPLGESATILPRMRTKLYSKKDD